MAFKRLIVIGAGAVGGSIGGLLVECGFPVVLVARGPHRDRIRRDGLTVHRPERAVHVKPVCLGNVRDVQWQQGDVALLATKLNDAEAVLDTLVAASGPALPVVCATNGVHGEAWTKQRFQTSISMLVWLPAAHLVPGEVRLYSGQCAGVLDNGAVSGGAKATSISTELCRRLNSAGFDAVVRPDMDRWKRAKWLTNLGSAAQALVTDDWTGIAKLAQSEGEAVLSKSGQSVVPPSALRERTAHVVEEPIDGAKRPGGSTWQSYHRGKPMESRWLEGALADLGDQIAKPAPTNRFLSDASLDPRPLTAGEVRKAVRSERDAD